MAVLLIRLCGPMQSWGTLSRFSHRDTELEPSKSGVIGLLGAALGRPREAFFGDLAKLRMGVRVDREGVVRRDYHTAGKGGYIRADGSIEKKDVIVSERFYLADACFLVALLGDAQLLVRVDQALQRPVWPLFLGRKSFVPGLPVWLRGGLRLDKDELEGALTEWPYLIDTGSDPREPDKLRLVLETEYGLGESVKLDQPVAFGLGHRRYSLRHVTTKWINRSELPAARKEELLCI